jgi:CHAT domain-containing protein
LLPAETFLTKKTKLVIIPDGVLNYLPFETLLTEIKKDNKKILYSDLPFLVKKYPVSYVQSASVLKNLLSQEPGKGNAGSVNKKLIAFGDPVYEAGKDTSLTSVIRFNRLEFSGKEVEKIASFFKPGSAEIFLRDDATEENVKGNSELRKYNYIHFATHGLIDEKKPDLSSLVLTQHSNPGEDGFLRATEIFNLDMNADLVVLSACQTGLGKLVRGEGMVGLTRAFMYAGTPAVMVSLWSVSDISTATLMGEFYKNLVKENLYKTDALRKAQLTLLKDEKYAHPFYWAPFVLVGDWR